MWLMAFAITVGFVEDDDADPPDDLDPAPDEPADHSAATSEIIAETLGRLAERPWAPEDLSAAVYAAASRSRLG